MQDLLSLLQRFGTVFPVFSIEFPFHIAYDVIIRLASSWILEDSAGELAAMFNGAFGEALRYMYEADEAFMNMCLDMWKATAGFAMALLPLMLILSIFGTVKNGASSSSLTIVKTRELAFGAIVNVGLAASSFWVFSKVLSVSNGIGRQMLAISGISAETGFTDIAGRIFLPTMLTAVDGSSEALLVVLLFLRLFLTLVLFLSIVLVSVSTRIGILLLFGISPVCFVLSVYEEFDWLRASWIKTFLGFILTPVIDGILLALIMLNNANFTAGISMGEVFRTLCMSIGVSCLIVILHSEVIRRIFDSVIADMRKAARAVKTAAQAIAKIVLAVYTGGSAAAAETAGKRVAKKDSETAAAKNGKEIKESTENKNDDEKKSGIGQKIERIRDRKMKQYDLKPDEMSRTCAAVRTVLAAMDEIVRKEYGSGLNTVVRRGIRPAGETKRLLDRYGGAAGIMAEELIDRAGRSLSSERHLEQEQTNLDSRDGSNNNTFNRKMRVENQLPDINNPENSNPVHDAKRNNRVDNDTFRNLSDIASCGLDIAMRGGSYEDVKSAIQADFDRKREQGFDMKF